MVATCPNTNCLQVIPSDHSCSWCTACGETLPASIQAELPLLQEGRAKGEAARAGIGMIEKVCAGCGTQFKTSSKLDFLGFLEVTCPQCHLQVTEPLRWSRRIVYWLFLGVGIWGLADIAFHPGVKRELTAAIGTLLLLLKMGSAVWKDLQITQRRRSTAHPALPS